MLTDDFFYPSHYSAYQAYFDSVRMGRRVCKNIPDNSLCQFPGALILLLYNLHMCPGFNINSVFSIIFYHCIINYPFLVEFDLGVTKIMQLGMKP